MCEKSLGVKTDDFYLLERRLILFPTFLSTVSINRTSYVSVKNRSSQWLLLMFREMPLLIIRLEWMSLSSMTFPPRISWPKSTEKKNDPWLLWLQLMSRMSIWKRRGLQITFLTRVPRLLSLLKYFILEGRLESLFQQLFLMKRRTCKYRNDVDDAAQMIQTQRHIKDTITSFRQRRSLLLLFPAPFV